MHTAYITATLESAYRCVSDIVLYPFLKFGSNLKYTQCTQFIIYTIYKNAEFIYGIWTIIFKVKFLFLV